MKDILERIENDQKEVKWTTGAGGKAVVTVKLIKERELIADHTIKKPHYDIEVIATVDGNKVGDGWPVKITHPVAVAAIGKLAMTQENLKKVQDAIAEIEKTPYAIAWKEKEKQRDAELRDYDKHAAAMKKAMSY
jgi:hypothetical protein